MNSRPAALALLFSLAVIRAAAAEPSAGAASPAEKFTDPAPPVFVVATRRPQTVARENPDARFHAAPKPLSPRAVTSDWPSFLGPTHNMFSPETELLKELPPGGPPLVWEMKKGEGFGAPAVVGDRLVLFHRVGGEEVVDCVHPLDGRRYWQFKYTSGYRDRYGYNSGPRTTPVIADGRVFTFGAEGRLHCLDLQTGEQMWRRDILAEFNLKQNFFGTGATPLVEDGKVILNVGAVGGPCVAAFDARTGRLLWGAGREWGPSYASAIPATVHGKRRVFVFAGGESKPPAGGLMSLDPATGNYDFAFPWRGKRYESVNASSPVVIGTQVFVSECYGSGGALVEVLPDGGARQIWTNPAFGMHFMCAIPLEGYLYGVHGHGPQDAELVCVDLKTGRDVWRTQPIWKEHVEVGGSSREMNVGTFRASLLQVDGRTLCLGEFGHLLWVKLSPTGFRELSRAWLFAATETWTPPVISRGLLYVCQNTRGSLHNEPPRLLCYDLRAPEAVVGLQRTPQ